MPCLQRHTLFVSDAPLNGAAVSDQDLENGNNGAPRKARKHEPTTLTPCQVVRWRWMRRVLSFSLFEPFIIDPFLKGTWLLNAWLRLMGADVSMGALILGRVADYGMVKARFWRHCVWSPLMAGILSGLR